MIDMQNFFLFEVYNKACRKNGGCYEREIYFPMIIPSVGVIKAKRRYWMPGAREVVGVMQYAKADKNATTSMISISFGRILDFHEETFLLAIFTSIFSSVFSSILSMFNP